MNRLIKICFILILSINNGYAQIPLNTYFKVSTPNPVDDRMTVPTLSDTVNMIDLYDGLFTWVQDNNELWRYDGDKWGKFQNENENSLSYLESSDTIYVCNDTCQYRTLNQAVSFASKYKNVYDSLSRKKGISIAIIPNSDGSRTRLTSGLNMIGQDLGHIEFTTFGQKFFFDAASGINLFSLKLCNNLNVQNFDVVGNNISRGFLIENTSNVLIQNSDFDSLGRGFAAFSCSGIFTDRVTINECFNGVDIAGSLMYMRRSSVDSCSYGIISSRNSNLHLRETDVNDSKILNAWVYQGGILSLDGNANVNSQGRLPNDVQIEAGLLLSRGGNLGTVDNGNIYNQVTELGLVIDQTKPVPFLNYTTVQEPSPTSGIRTYWNTDDNEYKVSPDNLNWEPLISPSNLAQEGANINDVLTWDGNKYVPSSSNTLSESITLKVCNDTCQYKSIGAALEYFANLQVPYDSTRVDGTVQIVRNSDGTPTILSELVHLKEEQNLGWVHITSNDDTVYYNKPASAGYLFRAEFTQFPRIINIHCISQNNGQFLSASLQSQATVTSCILENFESGIYGFKSDLSIDGNEFKNFSSRAVFLDLDSRAYVRNCTADNVSQLVYIVNGAKAYLQNNTVRNYSAQGIFLSDGIAQIDGGDYRNDGATTDPNDIFINEGNICVMTGGVMGGTNQPVNRISDAGLITRTGEPTPFGEYSTAQEPAASSRIRAYWNTDDNEYKVTSDGLTWEPLVPIGEISPSQIAYVDSNGEIVGDSSFVNNDGEIDIGTQTDKVRGIDVLGSAAYFNLQEQDWQLLINNKNNRPAIRARDSDFGLIITSPNSGSGGIAIGQENDPSYGGQATLNISTQGNQNNTLSVVDSASFEQIFTVTNTGKVGIGIETPLRALHISGPEEQLRLESTGTGGVDNWLEMVNTSTNVSAANIIQFYKGGNTSTDRTGSIGVPKSIGDSVIVIGLTNDTGNSDNYRFYMKGGENSFFQATGYGRNEVTGNPTTFPAFESNGRMIESPSPIYAYSTISEPPASSGMRVYFNTDDAELKISPDNLTWQPLSANWLKPVLENGNDVNINASNNRLNFRINALSIGDGHSFVSGTNEYNFLFGNSHIIGGDNSGILGGQFNRLGTDLTNAPSTAHNSIIIGGSSNYLLQSSESSVIAGCSACIIKGTNVFATGAGNYSDDGSDRSLISGLSGRAYIEKSKVHGGGREASDPSGAGHNQVTEFQLTGRWSQYLTEFTPIDSIRLDTMRKGYSVEVEFLTVVEGVGAAPMTLGNMHSKKIKYIVQSNGAGAIISNPITLEELSFPTPSSFINPDVRCRINGNRLVFDMNPGDNTGNDSGNPAAFKTTIAVKMIEMSF